MTTAVSPQAASAQAIVLPKNRGAYYGGAWHAPKSGRFAETINPGTGLSLGPVADAGAEDIDAAVAAAKAAFKEWRRVLPLERAKILRRIADILRQNANELAMIDAADCGNPVREMVSDAMVAAAHMEFFAGFVTEMKGSSIPMGPDVVNFSVREPLVRLDETLRVGFDEAIGQAFPHVFGEIVGGNGLNALHLSFIRGGANVQNSPASVN